MSCSYAVRLSPGKVIAFLNGNGITIDGHTEHTFTENMTKRYSAYGWRVVTVHVGNRDVDALRRAIVTAKACANQHRLFRVKPACSTTRSLLPPSCRAKACLGAVRLLFFVWGFNQDFRGGFQGASKRICMLVSLRASAGMLTVFLSDAGVEHIYLQIVHVVSLITLVLLFKAPHCYRSGTCARPPVCTRSA